MSITKLTPSVYLVVDLAQVFLKLGLHTANRHGLLLLEYSVSNAIEKSDEGDRQGHAGGTSISTSRPVDWRGNDCEVQGQDTTSADNNVDQELSG